MATMQQVHFSNTRLVANKKEGKFTPDANGYVTSVVGGLNIYNSAGEYYSYDGAKALFEQSSQFMRRIQRGALRGEVGHPSYERGMSGSDYINRMMMIDERNVCVHFSEIWLDFNSVKDSAGKAVVAIMAKLAPSGPRADVVTRAINNPNENMCFSVRGATMDCQQGGQTIRSLKNIITFDYVNEPGIAIAEKYNSPVLESIGDRIVTKGDFLQAVHSNELSGVATESSKESASLMFDALGWSLPQGAKPSFANW